jgi:hypothetical protein
MYIVNQVEEFGTRHAQLRKAAGYTHEQLSTEEHRTQGTNRSQGSRS